MSTHSHPDIERIEDEAALWAARLRGGAMTDADRALLTAWLERDPEHGWVLSRYRELGGELDAGYGREDAPALKRAARARRRRAMAATLAAAAALAVLLVVLFNRPQHFTTAIAERHVAMLADGSRVELNAATDIAVSLGRRERHVKLSRGEALFNVAKDAARPFIVETPAGRVRVTGTVFDVRAAAADRVEVTVLEGHVRVQPADARAGDDASLTPGRQATLARENVAVRELGAEAMQDVLAWREGQVVFDDTPLRDAMARFAAYHARTIDVAAEVADVRLGGRYSLDDLDGALEAMERALPVRVERGAAGTVKILPKNSR